MSIRIDPGELVLTPGARVWVAYSGGVDSTVLLQLLAQAAPDRVRAVHVHHGLQAVADDWARHCRRQCRQLGVPFKLIRVQVDGAGGLEAAARTARYEALAALLRPQDVLATAHHRHDQAETVLLRALRGTGIAGLAAMDRISALGRGRRWRPLLDVPREDLHAYARKWNLQWIEDPHNRDPARARSYLRHQVWPRLDAHFTHADEKLVRLAGHAAEAATLLSELADQDLATVIDRDDARQGALSIAALHNLSAARRRNLLYHLWRLRFGAPPPQAWFERLEREVLGARRDAEPLLALAGVEARRYRDRLYLMPALTEAPDPALRLRWGRRRDFELPFGCGVLRATSVPSRDVSVGFASGGERIRLASGGPSRSLKTLCQSSGVPGWVRRRMPLIYKSDELVAVAGYWRTAEADTQGLPQLCWEAGVPGAPTVPNGR